LRIGMGKIDDPPPSAPATTVNSDRDFHGGASK
jgi:hypothetical protein